MLKRMEGVVVDEDCNRPLAWQIMDRMLNGMLNELWRDNSRLRAQVTMT
jgi:hypothetical protein